MVNPDHQSPNAIPPRRSSTGVTSSTATSVSIATSLSSSAVPSTPGLAKPVLRPLSEASWISPPVHRRMSSTTSAHAANATANQPARPGPPPTNDTPTNAALNAADKKLNPNFNSISGLVGSSSAELPNGDGSRWSEEQERIVLGPFEYMLQQPGKDIRKQMILAFNRWLEVPEDKLAVIAKVITMLHNASLLVDDVEDSSLLRRGGPVAHNVFGVAQTLNAGNYVYFLALQELLRLKNPALVDIYTYELCNLHRGQGMDLYWRDTLTCPSEADYLDMVGNKTGGLFRLCIKLMQAESASGKDCTPLVNLMGLIFQIRDDYMNLRSTDYTQNKGLCEDLTEGKFSFPIIHAIRSNPLNLQLLNILRQKTTDEAVKRYAVEYMERSGSFDYTEGIVREMMDRARALVADIDAGAGRGDGILAILDKLAI